MRFSLVFENSGDTLPFVVKYNHELFEFFVEKTNQEMQNSFSDHHAIQKEVDQKTIHLNWAILKTNEVLHDLVGISFDQHKNLEQYLDQDFLNRIHCEWALSQQKLVDIDQLRHSSNAAQVKLGNRLHEIYPDDNRFPKLAPVLIDLGYIFPYEEVNMGIHRLENFFTKYKFEFKAEKKFQMFSNPFAQSMISNNDEVNFSFGYTYLGRQYYNKFANFDSDLKYPDHYNYEELEFAFHLSLRRPQTIPYSQEALDWANQQGIKMVSDQIPIANLENLEEKLLDYRKVLYRNSRNNNHAKIFIRG